jgi:putative tryptophan/tyrosine transport system substrate-binding protein
MWRRIVGFIGILGCSILVTPLVTAAQQTGRLPRIIVLYGSPREIFAPVAKVLEDQLGDLGYVNGRNIHIEHRGSNGTPAQAREIVAEAVALKPDILVVWGTLGAAMVKQATSSLPVVFLSVGVPVEIGLVASLRHPGGNMTGVTFEAAAETYARRLQLLQEVMPTLSRVALLYAVGDPNVAHAIQAVEKAAPVLGLAVQLFGVRDVDELDPTFATIAGSGAQGVLVVAGALTYTHRQKIADLALHYRLPSAHAFRETVAAGGLLSLGPNMAEIARKGAGYVEKLLKGASPGDLPVEQPTRYDVHLNLRTAQALGLVIPPTVLVLADEVLQ